MYRTSYPDRDYVFGQRILDLRTAIGLTQTALAEHLKVSRRAIIKWEDGSNYPNGFHLKNLIALAYKHRCFQAGQELEEINALWRGSHQKTLLDEVWLQNLLTSPVLSEFRPHKQTSNNDSSEQDQPLSQPNDSGPRVDWGNAQTEPAFYGREWELQMLTGLIRNEHCRVVTLLGIGGIGKSALAVTLMHQLANEFDFVIWRSLRDAEKCEDLLDELYQVLAPQQLDHASLTLERRINYLLEHFRRRRVLLVLDNLESLLIEGEGAGNMRPGYEGYGQLLRRIAETTHQSCLLLTSREKPADLISFEGNRSPVRAFPLARLSLDACEQLLANKEVKGTSTEQVRLIEAYAGNPLALKIVAQTILEVFDGEIAPFLEQAEIIFGGVRDLLDQQFRRLSELELSIMLWLAIMRGSTTFEELITVLFKPVSRSRILEAVEALRRRSLIERGQKAGSFTLQSVVLEYTTLRLINEVVSEIQQGKLVRLIQHNLVQAHAKDYVRQSQERLLVAPVLASLQAGSKGQAALLAQFYAFFNQLRMVDENEQGYGPANLVALVRWHKGDLRDLDLSGLVLRDVHLQGVEMQNTNLSGTIIRDSIFTETFGSLAAMAISDNGEYWIASNLSGEVLVWKASTYTLQRVWHFHNIPSRFSLSSDGRTIAIGVQLDGIKLWELDTGRLLRVLVSNEKLSYTYEVAFAPDGRRIAATTANATVRIWDAETGSELHTLRHSPGTSIPTLKWSPNGRLLAIGDVLGVIRLWEIPHTGLARCVQTFTGHTREVVGLSFSPDSMTLASPSPPCSSWANSKIAC